VKGLVFLILLVFLVLLGAWGGAIYYAESANNVHSMEYANDIQEVTREAWVFVRPLLQLIIVLLVLQWFLDKRGIQISFSKLGIFWDARLLVALIVILTFCLVSLSGMDDRGVKEAALVVIGFYFGSAHKRDGDSEAVPNGTRQSANLTPPNNPTGNPLDS
jgi:hypothetical protein